MCQPTDQDDHDAEIRRRQEEHRRTRRVNGERGRGMYR